MDDMLTIVRRELEAKRGSWQRIARETGMSYKTIERIRFGGVDPGYSKVLRLYQYLVQDRREAA